MVFIKLQQNIKYLGIMNNCGKLFKNKIFGKCIEW